MYSCQTTPELSPPVTFANPNESVKRYICIVGGSPSGGVPMFALLVWKSSGPPSSAVAAPSSVCVSTGSLPPVPPTSKLPHSSVKFAPSGLARWSW